MSGAATRWTALAVLVQTSLATASPAWPAAPPPSARAPAAPTAAPSPTASPRPHAAGALPAASAPATAVRSAPDGERCRRAALPRAGTPGSAREAASALASCLTGGSRPALPRHGGPVSLTARTMTVTGLFCPLLPLAHGVCRASSVVLDDPVVSYGGDHELCTSARRLTVGGTVRLRAEWLTGRLFGLLPLGFSTRVLPPVPLPYVQLTDVRALGTALSADDVRGEDVTMGIGRECG